MKNNITEIKNKRVRNWLTDIWPDRVVTSVEFHNTEKIVKIYFLERADLSEKLIKGEIIYPILSSFKNFTETNLLIFSPAMPPSKMKDSYGKHGYFKAAGHNLLTIAGFKIHLKNIGINVRIIKDQNYAYGNKNSPYCKTVYKIYPKTDVDYAMFIMYFNDDIGNDFIVPPALFRKARKLPISVKFGINKIKSNRKRVKK
jgi:hypothetical protein